MGKGKKNKAIRDLRIEDVQPLGKKILVNPMYDSDKIGSLYLPDTGKNPNPQVGSIVRVGPLADEAVVGDCVVFHPYHTHPITIGDHEYLFVDDLYWYGYAAPTKQGYKLFARRDHVVVQPLWEPEGAYQEGSVILVTRTFISSPQRYGIVINIGEGVTDWSVGDKVVLPPRGGYEIGFVDEPFYILPANIIPASVS